MTTVTRSAPSESPGAPRLRSCFDEGVLNHRGQVAPLLVVQRDPGSDFGKVLALQSPRFSLMLPEITRHFVFRFIGAGSNDSDGRAELLEVKG